MHPKLSTFLATGDIPKTSKERNLLLDLAKLELSQKHVTNRNMNYTLADGTPINSAEIAKLNAEAAAARNVAAVNGPAAVAELKRKLADAKGFRDAATLALGVVKAQQAARRPAVATAKASPDPAAKASPATARDVLTTYNSLPSGPAKREFLAKHGVEIQRIAKSL